MKPSTDMADMTLAPEKAGMEAPLISEKHKEISALDSKRSDNEQQDSISRTLARRDTAKHRTFSESWADLKESFGNFFLNIRQRAITATPRFLVNNSSNVLGLSHVATEVLMFKAGLKEGERLIQNPEDPINWVVQPVKRIADDIITKSKSRDYTFKQLFEGNFFSNVKKYIVDVHDASHREVDRIVADNKSLKELGKPQKPLSLGNSWQTRTTFAGLVVWSLSALLPERKESDQEVERMATMRTLHPIQYIGERIKQAVWIPEWTSHKRQMIGLGYVAIGICSMLGSLRQRRDLKSEIKKDAELIDKGLKQGYGFNGAYFFTSVLSLASSIPLLFALDENKAYSLFGTTMMLRIPLLFKSIGKKYEFKDPGRHSYTAGMVSFQAENVAQALIGGATKLPDGSIVDHEEEKLKAISEAKKIKAQGRVSKHFAASDSSELGPSSQITEVLSFERAMPERVEAMQQTQKDAALL